MLRMIKYLQVVYDFVNRIYGKMLGRHPHESPQHIPSFVLSQLFLNQYNKHLRASSLTWNSECEVHIEIYSLTCYIFK